MNQLTITVKVFIALNGFLVDGQWGQWSSITNCNQTCGYGYQHRYRKCDSPAAAYGGEKCYGPTTDYIGGCNAHLCPSRFIELSLYKMMV